MENEKEQKPLTKKERRELKRQEKIEERASLEKAGSFKRMMLWALVVVGIGGVIFGMSKLGGNNTSSTFNQSAALIDAISPSDRFKGNKESKVVLVEYSDLQCPACNYYYPLVKQLGEEFGDKIGIAYRHFPLPQHKNAKLAAQAAEAAGRQGKFWDMHNIVFDNQEKWAEEKDADAKEKFLKYAESLSLNMDQFKSDMELKEIKDKIESDYDSGVRSKVNATPTFFLNGEKIQNPRSYDEFKDIINKAIESNP